MPAAEAISRGLISMGLITLPLLAVHWLHSSYVGDLDPQEYGFETVAETSEILLIVFFLIYAPLAAFLTFRVIQNLIRRLRQPAQEA
jgi:peptidoglycan/LPS O-acetylase OafA/YrhL